MANVGNGDTGKVLQGTGITSGPTYELLGVNSGLQNHGAVIAQGNGAFTAINPGTAGQVLTSNGNAIDPSFQNATGGLLPWQDAVSSKVMVANSGYTTSGGSLVTLTLPASCVYGAVFRIVGNSASGWQVAQNVGQTIHFGGVSTTPGVLGFIQSTKQYDSIEILCTTANTDFTVINGPQGNLTYN